MSSPDVGDLSPEGPLPPLILLQQLLSAATQPSPIKAIFDRQELEVSAVCFLFIYVIYIACVYITYTLNMPRVCAGGRSGCVSVPGGGVHSPVLSAVRGQQLERGHHAAHRAACPSSQTEEAQELARSSRSHRPAAHGDGLPEEEHRVRTQISVRIHRRHLRHSRYHLRTR